MSSKGADCEAVLALEMVTGFVAPTKVGAGGGDIEVGAGVEGTGGVTPGGVKPGIPGAPKGGGGKGGRAPGGKGGAPGSIIPGGTPAKGGIGKPGGGGLYEMVSWKDIVMGLEYLTLGACLEFRREAFHENQEEASQA